jgi:hypothetical protein
MQERPEINLQGVPSFAAAPRGEGGVWKRDNLRSAPDHGILPPVDIRIIDRVEELRVLIRKVAPPNVTEFRLVIRSNEVRMEYVEAVSKENEPPLREPDDS